MSPSPILPQDIEVFIGADHGGFELKNQLKAWLEANHIKVTDCGAAVLDAEDDYPDYARKVAENVVALPNRRGILCCRTSAGMTMTANKMHGARAISAHRPADALHGRDHNNANILSLGGDEVTLEQAQEIVTTFLVTPFSGAERHQRRLAKIAAMEQPNQV